MEGLYRLVQALTGHGRLGSDARRGEKIHDILAPAGTIQSTHVLALHGRRHRFFLPSSNCPEKLGVYPASPLLYSGGRPPSSMPSYMPSSQAAFPCQLFV